MPEDDLIAGFMRPLIDVLPKELVPTEKPKWREIAEEEPLKKELMECGFENVTVFLVSHLHIIESRAQLFIHSTTNPVMSSLLADLTETDKKALFEKALKGIRDESARFRGFVLLVSARKPK